MYMTQLKEDWWREHTTLSHEQVEDLLTTQKEQHHQELQKAREEERERIANKIQVQIDYYSDYANDGGKVDERLATLLWCKHQSELDQPNK